MNSVQDATVTHYTQVTVADLIDLTSRLNAMLMSPPNKSLKTILLKYSHQYVQVFIIYWRILHYRTHLVLHINDIICHGGIYRVVEEVIVAVVIALAMHMHATAAPLWISPTFS